MYYLGEKFELLQGVAIALCLLGSVLVLKPPFLFPSNHLDNDSDKNRFYGGICCLTTAVLTGAAYNMVRELRNHCHTQTTVHYMTVVMCLMTPIIVLFQGIQIPTAEEIFYLILLAGFTTVSQSCFTRGLKFGTAGKSSIIGYTSILFTMIIDLIMQRAPDYLSIIGAASISSCVIVLFIEKKK